MSLKIDHDFEISYTKIYCMLCLDIVDCEFSGWEIGPCNATCGPSSFRTKTRKIVTKAANGGQECTNETEIFENCNLDPCPGNKSI